MRSMVEWEVRRILPNDEYVTFAHGPESTFPTSEERGAFREARLEIYVDGELFEEPKRGRKKSKDGV